MTTKAKTLIALSILTAATICSTANAESYSPVPEMRERVNKVSYQYKRLYDHYVRTADRYMYTRDEPTYHSLNRMVDTLDEMSREITHLQRVIYWHDTRYRRPSLRPTGTVAGNTNAALRAAENARVYSSGGGPDITATSREEAMGRPRR